MRSPRLLAYTAFATVVMAAPALAQYPPDPGFAFVTETRVEIGDCTSFGGGPFAPGGTVTVTDNGGARPSETADSAGAFRSEICFDSTATVGVHVLVGTGPDGSGQVPQAASVQRLGTRAESFFSRVPLGQAVPPPFTEVRGATRLVTATVIVIGVRLQNPDTNVGGDGSGLPRTGTDATIPALVAGLCLVLTGSGLTVAARRRRRTQLSRGA